MVHLSSTPAATPGSDPPHGGKERPTVTELHVTLEVNGEPREVDVEPRRLLVQVIREDLGLTGTHVGWGG